MKKALSIILVLTMLLSMTTLVSADKVDHEHQLMKMANMNCHYEECTICFELFNVGDHTFKDGKCTVCGHDEPVNPFEDVKGEAWYHEDVVRAVSTGIINGKTATEFKPDDFLTYAEAIKLAACMNQVYLNGAVTLTNGEPWYQSYVDYCKANKIITKEYNYNETATRAGYMEIFANTLPESALKSINNIPDGSIEDVANDNPYASFIYKLYRAGIVTGVDEKHNCKPQENIKRSEVAAIISRMMDYSKRKSFNMVSAGNLTNDSDLDDDDVVKKPTITVTIAPMPTVEPTFAPTVIKPEDVVVNTQIPTVVVTAPPQPTAEPTFVPTVIEPEDIVVNTQIPTIVVTLPPTKPDFSGGGDIILQDTPLTIHAQPAGYEAQVYGIKYELEVQVFGGKAPYTYEWQYKVRRDAVTIKNGDYAKDAESAALILSVEKENTLLGQGIYCVITDAEGTKVTTDTVKVYGPFSMLVDDWTLESGKNTLIGRVADGILKKGEKVSVIRDGKVIAIGVAEDLQMFNKSMDETVKGDNVGIVFNKENGVLPSKGDIVVKYQPSHIVDTSDIIN